MQNVHMQQHSDEEDQVMGQVMEEANAVPDPEFDKKKVNAAQRNALMAYHQQAKMNTAMMVVSLREGFKEALKETHVQLRQVEASLSTDIMNVGAQVDALKAQVATGASGPTADLETRWNHVEMRPIRYLMAWILHVGVSTNLGMPSILEFAWHPGQGQGDEAKADNHLTLINKSNVRLLGLFRDRFVPALPTDFVSQLEKLVHVVLRTVQLRSSDRSWSKHVRAELGRSAYKSTLANVWVVRTSWLTKLLTIERAHVRRGDTVLDCSSDFDVPTMALTKEGLLKFSNADELKDEDGKPILNKTMIKSLTSIVPVTPSALYEHAKVANGLTGPMDQASVQTLLQYTAQRRLWMMRASKEYLENTAFRAGVEMVQSSLAPQAPAAQGAQGAVHIGVDWMSTDDAVEPFMTLLCSELQMVPQEFRTLFAPAPAPAPADDEQEVETKEKPKKRKRLSKESKSTKPTKSKKRSTGSKAQKVAKVAQVAEVETEEVFDHVDVSAVSVSDEHTEDDQDEEVFDHVDQADKVDFTKHDPMPLFGDVSDDETPFAFKI